MLRLLLSRQRASTFLAPSSSFTRHYICSRHHLLCKASSLNSTRRRGVHYFLFREIAALSAEHWILLARKITSAKPSLPIRGTRSAEEISTTSPQGGRKHPKKEKSRKDKDTKKKEGEDQEPMFPPTSIEELVKRMRSKKMQEIREQRRAKAPPEEREAMEQMERELDEQAKRLMRGEKMSSEFRWKMIATLFTGFALLLLPAFGLYLLYKLFGPGSDDAATQQGVKMPSAYIKKITWSDFIERIVPSGEVTRISVSVKPSEKRDQEDSRNSPPRRAFVQLRQGARSRDGQMLDPFYFANVPNLGRLDSDVRAAEMAAGIPPERWASIEWQEPPRALSLGMSVLVFALLFGLPLFFIFRMMRNMKGTGLGGGLTDMMNQAMGHRLRIYDPASQKIRLKIKFRDVAGLHEAKQEISEFVDYLRRPQKYTKLGARLPKGALLTGPPGCGKTLLAKALAAESSVPFININGTEFVEMIGGLGASRIRQLFAQAKSKAPCIIYIDEIDAVGRKRSEGGSWDGGGNGEMEQTLNQLLVEMDGMDTAKGIVVIGSTNRPDLLDKALLRPGRFDRHVSVDMPTLLEREEMFQLYLRKIKKDNRLTGLSRRLAQMTPGFSGADISNVVNEAAIHAATAQKRMVEVPDVEYALNKIIAGPEKRSKVLVKEEREVVAFHESGHALVGWLLEHTEALLKVTIIPRTSAALGFAQYLPKDRKLFTREELHDRICMMLGGRAAENITFGRITTGAQNDLEKVTRQAQAMVKWYGMSELVGPLCFHPGPGADVRSADFQEKPYSKKLANTIDQEVHRIVSECYFRTEKLLKDNKEQLDKIANELLRRETLSYDDVKRLIGPPRYGDKSVVDLADDVLPDLPKMD